MLMGAMLLLLMGLLLLMLLLLLLGLVLLVLLLMMLMFSTLKPPSSPVPPFPSRTRTSITGRLRPSGVQGMLIRYSLHAQRCTNHILLYFGESIRATDNVIDLGTGDRRAGKN